MPLYIVHVEFKQGLGVSSKGGTFIIEAADENDAKVKMEARLKPSHPKGFIYHITVRGGGEE